jgi:AcrR family transcriptional regulator
LQLYTVYHTLYRWARKNTADCIADALGITPMAIYHHFPSRDALLTMITDREFAKLLTHIQVHPLRGTLEERLVAVWRGMSIICLH